MVRRIVLTLLVMLVLGMNTSPVPVQAASLHGADWDGTLRRIRMPILMYHYVEHLPADADDLRRGLTVSPELFAAQLDSLHDQGYVTIHFDALNAALMMGTPLPALPIILTFDDSYAGHYTTVYPLLQQRDMTGTFFLITAALDENRVGYMTWPQAQEMAQAGMEMASHTKNHPDLRNRDYDFLVYEMMGSMESIRAFTGQLPVAFAYPMGRYDAATLAVMQTLPPLRAVTVQNGIYATTDNAYELPRIRMTPDTSVYALSRLLQQ